MEDLESLPNIGPKIAAALRQVGITSPGELRAAGAERAALLLLNAGSYDCSHSLAALEGAIQGVPKSELNQATKNRLKRFLDQRA